MSLFWAGVQLVKIMRHAVLFHGYLTIRYTEAVAIKGSYYSIVNKAFIVEAVQCNGDERDVLSCKNNGLGKHRCGERDGQAGVKCAGKRLDMY